MGGSRVRRLPEQRRARSPRRTRRSHPTAQTANRSAASSPTSALLQTASVISSSPPGRSATRCARPARFGSVHITCAAPQRRRSARRMLGPDRVPTRSPPQPLRARPPPRACPPRRPDRGRDTLPRPAGKPESRAVAVSRTQAPESDRPGGQRTNTACPRFPGRALPGSGRLHLGYGHPSRTRRLRNSPSTPLPHLDAPCRAWSRLFAAACARGTARSPNPPDVECPCLAPAHWTPFCGQSQAGQ